MNTVGLVLFIIAMRSVLFVVCKYRKGLPMSIIAILGGAVPFILLAEGMLDNSPVNILLSGFTVFYFAFTVSRLSKS